MGLREQSKETYGLRDLGVIDGPRQKGFDLVTRLAAAALNAPKVALMMFDDESASVFLRASTGHSTVINPLVGCPSSGSVASEIRSENRTVAINDVAHSDIPHAVEALFFNAAACLGTPVHGPVEEPIGILTAMHTTPHTWTDAQIEALEGFAYLTSQQIMLKASFETLRLIKRHADLPVI